MYMKYNLNGEAGTFFDYILTNEKELKQELGTDDVNIDKTTQTIQYKGTTYSISENGSVKATEITKILELSSETITVDEYATETLTAIQDGTEDITWESSDTSVVTVAGSGENNQTATITAIKEGTATITAKTRNSGLSKECSVTVKIVYIDNSYVEYDVAYTDIYTGNKYTKLTGWRILNKVDNDDGTSNIDIISTGIPVGLYYHYTYVKDTKYTPWAGDDSKRAKYSTEYYTSGNDSNYNMYAVSGLRYNFKQINFKKQTESETYSNKEYGSGYYTEISKNGETQKGEIYGSIFEAHKNVTEVRTIMGYEIQNVDKNEKNWVPCGQVNPGDKKGLFILKDYTPDPHSTGIYWVASPMVGHASSVIGINFSGSTSNSYDYAMCRGVRPVVSLTNVKLKIKNGNSHVWEIVD